MISLIMDKVIKRFLKVVVLGGMAIGLRAATPWLQGSETFMAYFAPAKLGVLTWFGWV